MTKKLTKKTLSVLLIASVFTLIGFLGGCKEKENEPENPVIEKWIFSTGPFNQRLTVRLDLYPEEQKLYITTEGDTLSSYHTSFGNGIWGYYKIVGDTLLLGNENGYIPTGSDPFNKWLILQYTDEFFEIKYLGYTNGTIITQYLFIKHN